MANFWKKKVQDGFCCESSEVAQGSWPGWSSPSAWIRGLLERPRRRGPFLEEVQEKPGLSTP
jgi:hypothetical protein